MLNRRIRPIVIFLVVAVLYLFKKNYNMLQIQQIGYPLKHIVWLKLNVNHVSFSGKKTLCASGLDTPIIFYKERFIRNVFETSQFLRKIMQLTSFLLKK